jgi:hypothetical protein
MTARHISAPRVLFIALTIGLLAEFLVCVVIVALYVLA